MAKRKADESQRFEAVYRTLLKTYPKAQCALEHRNAFELLIATILSAQCTDERVNMTTPALFKRFPTPQKLAAADQEDVEAIVKSCGFYRNKAKNIRAASAAIVKYHAGQVPGNMDALLELPGVARKTANVVLGNAFDIHVGVVVDTHVRRLSNRLGFTEHQDPEKIEQDLIALVPQSQWTMLAHLLIWHGRSICTARKPACPECPVRDLCPKRGVTEVRASPFDQARELALKIINRRMIGSSELADRLRKKQFAPDVIAAVIDKLKASRFLDDAAYARTVIDTQRARKPIGDRLLKAKLRQRRIDQAVINKTVQAASESVDHVAAARKLVEQKLRAASFAKLDPVAQRRRLWGLLSRRGFDHDTIEAAMERLPAMEE
jgi:endonuclease-3